MSLARFIRLLIVIPLLAAGLPPQRAGAAPGWVPAAPMQVARADHSAVLLPDGEVLVVGGNTSAEAAMSAERYDPAGNRWRPAVAPQTVVGAPAAALLTDGRVLIYGATGGIGSPGAVERYDPATDAWTPGAAPPLPTGGTLTALTDGRALVVADGRAAVYNPAADSWTATRPLGTRAGGDLHAATLLHDGRVLVTGGLRGDCIKTRCINTTAERYDPATNSWTTVAPMHQSRANHRALALPSGQVLVVGSYGDSRTPERYDPASDTWADTGQLPAGFITGGQTLTALPDGRALLVVATVDSGGQPVSTALVYDPATDGWQPVAAPNIPRAHHTATLLRDGRVLVAGGDSGGASAELYGEASSAGSCFAETGHCLAGSFLAYWEAHGGLAQFGFPLTGERWEVLSDGKPYTVQYFERARFEHHPENAGTPYEVLLGQFGRTLYLLDPSRHRPNAAPPLPGATYFEETGHNLGGRFLAYWQDNGGLAQFGFPLSEEIRERLEDGDEYTVQYFERARLEYHPENAAPYDVLLGQFGRRILAAQAPVGQLPYPVIARFAPVYAANEGIRARLNAPLGPGARVGGATLPFQRGWMLYRADTRTIYVLASEADGGSIPVGAALTFPDTWDESQPPGGGPGPGNLVEPSRGFGKVWREHPEVRERLGYATAPSEQGQTLTLQDFGGGVVLDAPEQGGYGPRGLTYIVYTNGRYEVHYYGV
jgi:hypothetical protein